MDRRARIIAALVCVWVGAAVVVVGVALYSVPAAIIGAGLGIALAGLTFVNIPPAAPKDWPE